MVTFTVLPNEAEALSDFFSEKSRSNIGKEGFYTIGACDDEGFVTGVLQFYVDFSQEHGCFGLLSHMYIQDEFKDTETAKTLIDEFESIMSASGIKDRLIHLPAIAPKDSFDFYNSLGFEFDDNVFFVFSSSAKEFVKHKVIEKASTADIKSIADLGDDGFVLLQKAVGCEKITKSKNIYDQQLSSFFVNKKGCGLFLIKRLDNGHLVTSFLGCNTKEVNSDILSLIAYSAKKAQDLCGPDAPIYIICKKDYSKELITQLFPDVPAMEYMEGVMGSEV